MFGAKTKKSELPRKSNIIVHNPHKSYYEREAIWSKCEYRRVVSIDPGEKNFAIRIEVRPMFFDRPWTGPNGVVVEKGKIVTEVFAKECFEDVMEENVKEDQLYECNIYLNMTKFLDKFKCLLEKCHIFIIEKQLHINYRTVRVSQHVLTYCYNLLADKEFLPLILEIDSKIKTRQLNAPPNMSDVGIKQWSTNLALELLKSRGDIESLNVINTALKKKGKKGDPKKKDDLADTVIQIEATFSRFSWPVTPIIQQALTICASSREPLTDKLLASLSTSSCPSISKTPIKVPAIPVINSNVIKIIEPNVKINIIR